MKVSRQWLSLCSKGLSLATAILVTMQIHVGLFLHNLGTGVTIPANYYKVSLQKNASHLFLPEQVLERYIQLHGVDALQRNPSGRKYAIAYYNCPHRAGNAVHSFLNALIWCIVTNRTVLWRYDAVTAKNNVTDCDPVLHRYPWMASYDEWSTKLSLPDWSYVKMNTYWNKWHAKRYGKGQYRQLYKVYTNQQQRESLQQPIVAVFPRFRDWPDPADVNVSRVHWYDDPVSLTIGLPFYKRWWYQRGPHLESPLTVNTMKLLYTHGRDFLYGMLFRYCFRIEVAPKELPQSQLPSSAAVIAKDGDASSSASSAAITIGLHSRHAYMHLDGSDVQQEIQCLAQLIPPKRRDDKQECFVYLMSDRQLTLDRIGSWLQKERSYCRNVTVSGKKGDRNWGFLPEMGDFAGAAFMSDLALVSEHARTGFVGQPMRSSTQLVMDLMTYNRKAAVRDQYGVQAALKMPEIDLCTYWRKM